MIYPWYTHDTTKCFPVRHAAARHTPCWSSYPLDIQHGWLEPLPAQPMDQRRWSAETGGKYATIIRVVSITDSNNINDQSISSNIIRSSLDIFSIDSATFQGIPRYSTSTTHTLPKHRRLEMLSQDHGWLDGGIQSLQAALFWGVTSPNLGYEIKQVNLDHTLYLKYIIN